MSADSKPELTSPEVIADLAARFLHARRAALRDVVGGGSEHDSEGQLLERALSVDASAVEQRVFENCLALGRGFARFFGRSFSLGELPRVLPELGSPCFDGVFSAPGGAPGLLLLREGCSEQHACNYWREAMTGLVLGATDGILCSRHEARGSGGTRCVDAFFFEPDSPHRFGPVPDEARDALEAVTKTARTIDPNVELEFLGVNEGVLHYRVLRDRSGDTTMTSIIERSLCRRIPTLKFREITARAVFASGD